MPIRNHITDPSTKLQATVENRAGEEENALVVATRPLKTFSNEIKFFTNPIYGIDMNQDATTGAGVPEQVHNGEDNVYWTGSSIVGVKTIFNSGDQNHTPAGAQSIKTDNPAVNDVYQFARGSDLDLSNYFSLTIWVYVDKDWNSGDSIKIYGWDTGTASQIGTAVFLEDYFTWSVFDTWHNISIPLSDMNLAGTIDAIRTEQVTADGKAPKYYLDDIQFEKTTETGNIITYTIEPDKETWLHVCKISITVVSAYDSTIINGTLPGIPYDDMLGVSLAKGVIYQRFDNKKVDFTVVVNKLIDFLQLPDAVVTGQGYDGSFTWLTVTISTVVPLVLKSQKKDNLRIIIKDDLSGLEFFRVSAGCKKEIRH